MKLFKEALEIKGKIERGDLIIGVLESSQVEKMQDLFLESAKIGNTKAWFQLGMCYYTGLIHHEEAAFKAAEYFKKAGESGYGVSAWKMYIKVGYFYSPTNIEPKEVKDILETYLNDDETGELALFKGYMLLKGYGYKEDHLASSEAILLSAKKGNKEAMFELYIYYHFGYGVDKNQDTAIAWCLKAAENENIRALYNMGTIYASGYGSVTKSINKAVNWYVKASETGHGKAAATLALMYVQGVEIEKNLEKAKYYFQLADKNDYGIEAEVMLENEMEIPKIGFSLIY